MTAMLTTIDMGMRVPPSPLAKVRPARRSGARAGARAETLPLAFPGVAAPLRDVPEGMAGAAVPPIDPSRLVGAMVREGQGVYSLVARGDAMRDALVGDGDVIMVQPTPGVAQGELAAVRLRGHEGVALRRVYYENGNVRLQPENRRQAAAVVARDEVKIEGRVIAIVRQRGI